MSKVHVVIFVSWVLSLLLALPPLLGWGSYTPELNGMSCAPSWTQVSSLSIHITEVTLHCLLGGRCPLQHLPLHPRVLPPPHGYSLHLTGGHHQAEKRYQQHTQH